MKLEISSCAAAGSQDIAVTFRFSEGSNASFETLVISDEQFIKMKLAVGECDRDTYDAVSSASEFHFAMKKGLGSLAFGSSSKINLVRKLESKGIKRDVAEAVCLELERRGYIDDEKGAAREAELAVAKLWGKRRIAAELSRKGYGAESIKHAIYSLEDSGTDFAENCAEIIRRRGGVPDDPKERQKLYASLAHYGYSYSEINLAAELIAEDI